MGQSVQIGNTAVAVKSIRTDNGSTVSSEWSQLKNHAKTQGLLSWVQGELRCTATPDPAAGFTTTEVLSYARTGVPVTAEHTIRLTFIPVKCQSPRYPGATVALMLNRYVSAPTLAYPRLLVRYGNNDWMIEEVSLRHNNRPTVMTARFGDCVFRTGLRILEQRNSAVARSLYQVLTTNSRENVFNSLKRVYDIRMSPVGQRELALYSGILISSNLEEEFVAGYISSTLDQNFKPDPRDSWAKALAKDLAKKAIDELRKEAGKYLWKIIANWLGIGVG